MKFITIRYGVNNCSISFEFNKFFNCFLFKYFESLSSKMKLLNSKYKTRIKLLFLTVYLFTFVSGIIHYHSYEFCYVETFDLESKQTSNHFQILNGIAYQCIIHQNLLSIQTAFTEYLNDHQLVKPHQISFTFFENNIHTCSVHLSNNLLRAPPATSDYNYL